MPLRNVQPLTIRPFGVCDAVDGTNVQAGAMVSLANLIPSPTTKNQFVPRPAATQITNFASFTAPAQIEALLVIGTRAYGMIASGRFAGKSEPFCYDLNAGAFIALGNVTAANCPTTQPATGDWTPPTMAMVGQRICITHPGYDGVSSFTGWIDLRTFTLSTTGTVASGSKTISNVATVVGMMIGDAVTGAGIPANTYITAIGEVTPYSITMSQAATANGTGEAIAVTSGTIAAPVYGAGQTNGVGLLTVATGVAQFNGRAWYAVGNLLLFSDALNPQQITNASQQLTIGDSTPITALGGLPLSNQVTGGVLQALIAFKAGIYYQITGDQATSNLSSSAVAGAMGTVSPNSLCATPNGLAFVAADGLRVVGLDGKCSDPIGANGQGVNLPFLYALYPTRIAAAYVKGVVRVSLQNGYINGQPTQEYWYDMVQQCWTGPHSFPATLIQAEFGTANSFVMAATGVSGKLWQSTVLPSAFTTYTENGAALSWSFQTTLQPDNQQMASNTVVQTAIGMVLPASQSILITANDEQNNALDTITMASPAIPSGVWGNFNWGGATWGGSAQAYQEYNIPWHNPLNFKQMSLTISGQSTYGFAIGNIYAGVQATGFLGAH